MLTVRNIYKRYGPVKVLLGVNFSISEGQKIALVGQNGVGKSTLLRILAGIETEDRGVVEKSKRLLVGYLPQEVTVESSDEAVSTYLFRASGLEGIEREMKKREANLGDERVLGEYGELQESFERLGGFVFEKKARAMLDGLGLERIGPEREVTSLSGGEKRRMAICGVLLHGADLLLLDEPTNDLDLPALLFLETFLRGNKAAVIVASHDREFLDAVVGKVLELDWFTRTAELSTGNYTIYRKEKSERLRLEREESERNESERMRLRETSDEKKEWARIGGQQKMPDKDKMSQGFHRNRSEQKFGAYAKSLRTRSDKVERVKLTPLREELAVLFEPQEGTDRDIALFRTVCGYPDTDFRVGPIDLEIPYGKRAGIFGRNGAGKSTVLRTISGVLEPISGTVTRGEHVVFAELSQENDIVPKNKTAQEWFSVGTPIREPEDIHLFLGKFLLNADASEFRMGELSPGERMRLSLAYFMANGANVLFLDEPTNHLDMEAIAALESALDLYRGTLILVSHDRAFLSRVALSDVYSLERGSLVRHADYAAYAETAKKEAASDLKGVPFDGE